VQLQEASSTASEGLFASCLLEYADALKQPPSKHSVLVAAWAEIWPLWRQRVQGAGVAAAFARRRDGGGGL
jgi:hypothetical protein